MLPIFVINLDRRPDRMRSIAANLDRLGLKAHRIPAVDAKTVSDEELHERVCFTGLFRTMEFDRGAGACVLSHLRALETFLTASDAPAALVLEDDAELAADLPMFIESVDWWPTDTGLINFETRNNKWRLFSPVCAEPHHGRELRRIEVFVAGACGYVANRDSARHLLDNCRNIAFPMDHVLFDVRNCKIARNLRPVQVLPGLVCQPKKLVDSDLDEFRKRMEAGRAFRRAMKNVKTIPHKIVTGGRVALGQIERCETVYRSKV